MARPSPAFLCLSFVVLVAALLYLPGLGSRALLDYDESGYAAIAVDTFHSHDPLTLSIGDHVWFEKPPLYFWVSAVSNAVVPDVELASRLPAALAGIACVLLTWLILYGLASDALLASFGALLLATTASFIDIARQGRVDTLVLAFSLLLIYASMRAFRNPRWLVVAGGAFGLAVMTKDIAAFFVLPMLFVWIILERKLPLLRTKEFWKGVVCAALIALPWHLYETWRFGQSFWNTYLFRHVLERYGSDLLGTGATNMVYIHFLSYYASVLTFFFIGTLVLYVFCFRSLSQEAKRFIGVFAFGALSILAVFFSAHTKVVYYLPFAYPFMAIASALLVGELMKHEKILVFSSVLILSLAIGLHAYLVPDAVEAYERRVAEDERVIGLMLRPLPGPVDFTSPVYWETIRFYGGRKELESWQPDVPRPAYVVVHSRFENPLASTTSELLYKGSEVSLYRVP